MGKKSLAEFSDKQIFHEAEKRYNKEISRLEKKQREISEDLETMRSKYIAISGSTTTNVISEIDDMSNKPSKIKKSMSKTKIKSDKPLKDRLITICSDGQTRSINEILDALRKDGWVTSSKKPYQVVAAQLAGQSDIFQRVQKGMYKINATDTSKLG